MNYYTAGINTQDETIEPWIDNSNFIVIPRFNQVDGENNTIADYKENDTYLNFWIADCEYSIKLENNLAKIMFNINSSRGRIEYTDGITLDNNMDSKGTAIFMLPVSYFKGEE